MKWRKSMGFGPLGDAWLAVCARYSESEFEAVRRFTQGVELLAQGDVLEVRVRDVDHVPVSSRPRHLRAT